MNEELRFIWNYYLNAFLFYADIDNGEVSAFQNTNDGQICIT